MSNERLVYSTEVEHEYHTVSSAEIKSKDDAVSDFLQWCSGLGDPECSHHQADDALLDLLEELGFEKVVKAFRAVPKWYA